MEALTTTTPSGCIPVSFACYSIAGFTIASPFELPSLEACQVPAVQTPDVRLHLGSPLHATPPTDPRPYDYGALQAQLGVTNGFFWFELENVGQMWVKGGSDIYWQPHGQHDVMAFRTLLVNTLLAAIAHQRLLLPLHISAVDVGGQAFAFQGKSGSGKSTLAAMFMKRGYRTITEDLGIVEPDGEVPIMRPGLPYYRLWRRTLQHLNESHEALPTAWQRSRKHHRPVGSSSFAAEPLPLARIYFLQEPDDGKRMAIEPIQGFEATRALLESVILGICAQQPGQHERFFRQCTEVTQHCACYRLVRPKDFEVADRVLDLLEAHFAAHADAFHAPLDLG